MSKPEGAPVRALPTTYLEAMGASMQGVRQGIQDMDTATAQQHADLLLRLATDAHSRCADLEGQLDLALSTVDKLHELCSGLRRQVSETRNRWAAEVAQNLE